MKFISVYFSPTGGTMKTAKIIERAFNEKFQEIDLISSPRSIYNLNFEKDDICVFSIPSFGGRVPYTVLEKMKDIKGNGAKAILVAVFGNRAIDDTLMELYDFLIERDFTPIAAIESVAEHSLCHSIAKNRPDKEDERKLIEFVNIIKDRFNKNPDIKLLNLPGSHNYKEFNGVPIKPITTRKCTACGLCASVCPVKAIDFNNPKKTDNSKCISCMHCISVCPVKGRKLNKLIVKVVEKKLKNACSFRKEGKLYL